MGRSFLKIMKMIHENCDPELANDKTLPNNAFIIEYKVDDVSYFDIVAAAKQNGNIKTRCGMEEGKK